MLCLQDTYPRVEKLLELRAQLQQKITAHVERSISVTSSIHQAIDELISASDVALALALTTLDTDAACLQDVCGDYQSLAAKIFSNVDVINDEVSLLKYT